LVYSDGIPPVPRNAKISEFCSEPIPWKRKMLGIPYRGTKFKQNSRNFVPNRSAEEKITWNSVPWNIDENRKPYNRWQVFFLGYFCTFELCGPEIGHLIAVHLTGNAAATNLKNMARKDDF
jgi:hypothetical protein